jgi:hypothetical protein
MSHLKINMAITGLIKLVTLLFQSKFQKGYHYFLPLKNKTWVYPLKNKGNGYENKIIKTHKIVYTINNQRINGFVM